MEYPFHKLTPIKEFKPGWFKLRWKPIKNGTWNFVKHKQYRGYRDVGMTFTFGEVYNGWGRGYKSISLTIGLFWFELHMWIAYDFYAMREGASDERPPKPLDFTNSKLK